MERLHRTVTQACPHCNTIQELPAIFCWMCGAPLLRISYWAVWFFLTVTAATFGIYGLYAKELIWPMPLYLYYVFVFLMLSLIISRRQYWMGFRVVLWSLILIYSLTFLVLTTAQFFHNLSTDAIEVMQNIRRTRFGVIAFVSVIVFNLVIGGIALTRRFNFTLAYRIFISFAAAMFYVGARLLEEPETGEPKKLSAIAIWMPDSTIAEFLGIMSLNCVRILAAEIVVYSVIKSFAPANARFMEVAKKIMRNYHYGSQPQSVMLQGTSQLTMALLRAGVYIQYFFITLWHTITNYAWGMYRTIRRLTIDFVTPVATLAGISFLLGLVSEHTAAYINGKSDAHLLYLPGIHMPLVMIGIAVLGISALHILFLASVTKYRWTDLWRCNALLAMWLGPFVFAVFVFISLMLIATGTVLRHWGHETFPYRLGPLTMISGACLIAMVAFVLIYRQRQHQHPGDHLGIGAQIRKRLLLTGPAAHMDEEQRSA